MVIHYCWFGHNPKTPLIEKCIQSWKKFFPDAEVKEWNESNFDVNCCDYTKEAYQSKKYAFVSDYCRLWVLYNYGGIYFDTDVEVIADCRNILSENTVGFERKKVINPGLVLSCEKGFWFCKEMLELYSSEHFINNYTTICERATSVLKKHGLVLNNTFQIVDGINVYPTEYFNPRYPDDEVANITKNTVAIHHFACSWIDEESKKYMHDSFAGRVYSVIEKLFGYKFARKIKKIKNRLLH